MGRGDLALIEALQSLKSLQTELLLPMAGSWNEMTFKSLLTQTFL